MLYRRYKRHKLRKLEFIYDQINQKIFLPWYSSFEYKFNEILRGLTFLWFVLKKNYESVKNKIGSYHEKL